jgi:formylglycine-generating enzyme required for sulfatase activity
MAACRITTLAFTTLILAGSSWAQSDFIDLGKSRVIIVKIPAGTFSMGSDQVIHADDAWNPCPACAPRNEVERPVHRVTISRDFWMGRFDVTQKQWQEVMGNNPSGNRAAGPDAPVEQVSWKDVQSFLAKANAMQTRWTLRLPTEAEWEYAARAGSTGETYGPVDAIAWYKGNAGGATHPVGQKKPNDFGLYDMLGNVWQWCQGWFGPYPTDPVTDPQGAPTGDMHPTRGGCYYCDAVHGRAARRNRDLEDHSSLSIGFRIVAVPRKAIAPKQRLRHTYCVLGFKRAASQPTDASIPHQPMELMIAAILVS